MKNIKLLILISITVPLFVFLPFSVMAEEVGGNSDVSSDKEIPSEEKDDNKEPNETEQDDKPVPQKEEPIISIPVVSTPVAMPVVANSKPAIKSTSTKPAVAPKVVKSSPNQLKTNIVSPSAPVVAAAVKTPKIIPANPTFSPNEFPKNNTLVFFSKIRPGLILIGVLYLIAATIYLRKDAKKMAAN